MSRFQARYAMKRKALNYYTTAEFAASWRNGEMKI